MGRRRELPEFTEKVERFAIATEHFLRTQEEKGKQYRKALQSVNQAEAALYDYVDRLRACSREFGRIQANHAAAKISPA